MKIQTLLFLLPCLAVSAQTPQSSAAASFQTPALLVQKDNTSKRVWLVEATKSSIRYRETEKSADPVAGSIEDFSAIYVDEPREFTRAMDLYQGRKYQEAQEKFGTLKESYSPLLAMANNHASLAAFYEMECMRRLGNLEGLNGALQKFTRDPLTRETQLRQIELYVLWDAVRTKSWERLDNLCKERVNARLPGDQRAQVAYCHGLALEGLKRPEEALFAYSTTMTADAGASEELARQAALRVLAIHKANVAVQNAIKAWGTSAENKNGKGYTDLLEAAGVAGLFELSLGAGTSLPAEYKLFLKYKAGP